jgi:eukaryotic-like serine/threonine-protein kinase
MSHGGYGGGDPFGSGPFQGDPFSVGRPDVPQQGRAPHSAPPGSETNTLATLSVVFAFVFAPAGAVLGHLGLAQIGRTGQGGRDRALVGVTLSYVFIVVAVVAVAVWTITGGNPTVPATVVSPTTVTASPPTTTTPPAPLPPPPPPTVDGAGLPGLLLSLDEMKALTGDSGLTIAQTETDVSLPQPSQSTYEPADCIGSFLSGTPPPYQDGGYRQFLDNVPQNTATALQVVQSVATFADAAAAQRALSGYVALWTRCAGTTLTRHSAQEGTYPIALGAPQDAGAGVTTLVNHQISNQRPFFRAIAVKANVLVDIQDSGGAETPGQAADVAKRILARIPG